jgi:delta8-fatty-acid desaturase
MGIPKTPITVDDSRPQSYLKRSIIDQRVAKGEILVIIHNKVYDLTRWIDKHPGGELAIKHLNGKDATDAVLAVHPPETSRLFRAFYIGDIDPREATNSVISQDYRELEKYLRSNGYYEIQPWFWIRENIKFFILWSLMVYCVVFWNTNLSSFLGAFIAAQLWHQVAFVAHDAGHSGISQMRKQDTMYGIFLANFFG